MLAALDLLGEAIRRRVGPAAVLPLGTREMREVLEAAGHTVVGFDDWRRAGVVAVGNDPLFDFGRLRAASRAVAGGRDALHGQPRPAAAGGAGRVRPWLRRARRRPSRWRAAPVPSWWGSPTPPSSRWPSSGSAVRPAEAMMVGDSLTTDVAGGRAAGMVTVWVDPEGERREPGAGGHGRPRPRRAAGVLEGRSRLTGAARRAPRRRVRGRLLRSAHEQATSPKIRAERVAIAAAAALAAGKLGGRARDELDRPPLGRRRLPLRRRDLQLQPPVDPDRRLARRRGPPLRARQGREPGRARPDGGHRGGGRRLLVEAIRRLIRGTRPEHAEWGIAVMVVSTVVSWLITRHLRRVGRETDSIVLMADALHYQTDVWTNAGVLVGLALLWADRLGALRRPHRDRRWPASSWARRTGFSCARSTT